MKKVKEISVGLLRKNYTKQALLPLQCNADMSRTSKPGLKLG
jgi:hypothetical protein